MLETAQVRCAEVWTGVGAEGPEEGPGRGKVRGKLTECSAHGWVPRERGWEESKMAWRFWALRAPAEEASGKAAGFTGGQVTLWEDVGVSASTWHLGSGVLVAEVRDQHLGGRVASSNTHLQAGRTGKQGSLDLTVS